MHAQKHNFLQRGFTIVELIVVIVILGIIMSLAVVSVINSQVGARDTEREEDVQAIARFFESFYDEQINPFTGTAIATYPGAFQATWPPTADEVLGGLDRRALFSPSATVSDDYQGMSLTGATNTSEDPNNITPKPGQGNDIYVYQPLQIDDSTCTWTADAPHSCVRFNLYYWNEANNEVRKITSRNQ